MEPSNHFDEMPPVHNLTPADLPPELRSHDPPRRSFKRSDSIGALAGALAKAQGSIQAAAKDSANPFFHSKYADLASVWNACRTALSEAGVSIMQFPRVIPGGVEVETLMAHSSGEWVSEVLSLPATQSVKDKTTGKMEEKFDAQTIGSAITYARRYALSAFVGVAPDDDDGNAATGKRSGNNGGAADQAKMREAGLKILEVARKDGPAALDLAWQSLTDGQKEALGPDMAKLARSAGLGALEEAAGDGLEALEATWKALPKDMRGLLKDELPRLKELANAPVD